MTNVAGLFEQMLFWNGNMYHLDHAPNTLVLFNLSVGTRFSAEFFRQFS